jgi:hypothetical protein
MPARRDVFLCHASEDKQGVARPLCEALRSSGISCWLDEAEIRWGDSTVDLVNLGLHDSTFVIVILSTTFLDKPWPRRELAAALSTEASSGIVRVLPLLVGEPHEKQAIVDQFPLLHDKLYIHWDGETAPIVKAMLRRLGDVTPDSPEIESSVQKVQAAKPYCERCGEVPGNRTACIGSFTAHNFVNSNGQEFCRRCGEVPGTRTSCIGSFTAHDFANRLR